MDRFRSQQPQERQPNGNHHAPPPPTFRSPFPPHTAQPPVQIPFSDPFPQNRDPFFPGGHARRGSIGMANAWTPAQGNGLHHASTPEARPLPPPPPQSAHNHVGQMAHPLFDAGRRRSLGGAGSPAGFAQRPLEPPALPPSFPARNMPPPSPPQIPSSASSSLPGSGPRGPPTASPFAGVRDLASFASSHRSGAGMSISSILGNNDDRRPAGSPHSSAAFPSSTTKSMQPPSPARARATSMRDGYMPRAREPSPGRASMFIDQRPASVAFGHERTASEPRRDGLFGSPQVQRESAYSFRNFQASRDEPRPNTNGNGAPGRPLSQPVDPVHPRTVDEMLRREHMAAEGRLGMFRAFGDHHAPPPPRSDVTPRHETAPFQTGAPTSQPVERSMFSSPQMNKELHQLGQMRFQPGSFGTPIREDQTGLFRPAFQGPSGMRAELPRESIESRLMHEMPRDLYRSSPPPSDMAPFPAYRNGFPVDRPLTFEEHQRLEAMREQQVRKESDGSAHHRSLLNISPEMDRRGRNSPLPQAVQGVQPQRFGPGGSNPGIKSEFGRMFSGLGSGVGSTTPTAGQSVNGTTTPSRISPMRHIDSGDLVRTAVAEIEDGSRGRGGSRGGKRNGRRSRSQVEKEEVETYDGRMTPSLSQRNNKKVKTQHHHHHHGHHHHHHHHEEPQPGSFNMLRFPSNPLTQQNVAANASHHHHHHHITHAHPGHHHHHPPRSSVPPARKPSTTVVSTRLLDEVAGKPRKHLGTQLYTTELALPSAKVHMGYSSKMKPIPVFTGRENCTYTVRVPRWYLRRIIRTNDSDTPSPLEMICKERRLFGTEVYTDDSDVVAAAVHSGWLKGDFGDYNDDLHDLCDNYSEAGEAAEEERPLELTSKPSRPVTPPEEYDAHVTVLILPPLDSYAATNQHHLWSREWRTLHDGMSFMIHRVDFVDEGALRRAVERTAKAKKARIAVEEMKRREAAAGLVMMNGVDHRGHAPGGGTGQKRQAAGQQGPASPKRARSGHYDPYSLGGFMSHYRGPPRRPGSDSDDDDDGDDKRKDTPADTVSGSDVSSSSSDDDNVDHSFVDEDAMHKDHNYSDPSFLSGPHPLPHIDSGTYIPASTIIAGAMFTSADLGGGLGGGPPPAYTPPSHPSMRSAGWNACLPPEGQSVFEYAGLYHEGRSDGDLAANRRGVNNPLWWERHLQHSRLRFSGSEPSGVPSHQVLAEDLIMTNDGGHGSINNQASA